MTINLSNPVTRDGAAENFDIRQLKKALNRLGLYMPFEKTGITGIPDTALFNAIRDFQRQNDLPETGQVRPNDETVKALNKTLSSKPSGQYIWRTVGDDRVREEHAELDGTLRDFSDSPDPGEEYNCRCWVELVSLETQKKKEKQEPEGLTQELITPINDAEKKWTRVDFIYHFLTSGGKEVSLPEIGLFKDSVNHAENILFENVLSQVVDKAKLIKNGPFTGSWNNSYPFGEVAFALGGVTIRGRFGGKVITEDGIATIEANAEYEFYDLFTDPLNVRERKIGTSAIEDIPYDFTKPSWHPHNIAAAYLAGDSELVFGTPYEITGNWETKITGSIAIK